MAIHPADSHTHTHTVSAPPSHPRWQQIWTDNKRANTSGYLVCLPRLMIKLTVTPTTDMPAQARIR